LRRVFVPETGCANRPNFGTQVTVCTEHQTQSPKPCAGLEAEVKVTEHEGHARKMMEGLPAAALQSFDGVVAVRAHCLKNLNFQNFWVCAVGLAITPKHFYLGSLMLHPTLLSWQPHATSHSDNIITYQTYGSEQTLYPLHVSRMTGIVCIGKDSKDAHKCKI